ncbi:sterol desaturase family protein [Acidisphaera sp. S103]|uniref:sterol desaturase family protein n=1 Tax=Acidisphaera sp. S103 TaxID=1747223 RepID=UPI001C20A47B|nr:sterol desaturase family protein [Acidisphaera sp. S103]
MFIGQHLLAIAKMTASLSVWLVVLALVFLPLERLFSLRRARFFRAGFLTDLGYYFINGILPALALGIPLGAAAWVAHRWVPASATAAFLHAPLAARLVVALVVMEVGFYWGHRWCHEIPFLWRFHAVHHSPTHVDWLVNSRGHPVDFIFTRLCGLMPLFVLGLGNPMGGDAASIPLIVMLLGPVWGFFIHANVRWRFGPLEWLVATPAFHHWHHTNDGPALINKNYAPMLPWVDRLFGSYYLPKDRQPSVYGTHTAVPPGLVGQLLDPFAPVPRYGDGSIDSTASAAASEGVPDAGRSSVRASANP